MRALCCCACYGLVPWDQDEPHQLLQSDHVQSLAALLRQLAKLEGENKALERDAERFRKREQLQLQMEDIRKKVRSNPSLRWGWKMVRMVGGVPAVLQDSTLCGPFFTTTITNPLQEVWMAVADRQDQVDQDQQALILAKELLQRHLDEAADDAAPLK